MPTKSKAAISMVEMLNPGSFLVSEYQALVQTHSEGSEFRRSTLSIYFASVVTLVGSFFLQDKTDHNTEFYAIFAIVFLMFALISMLTLAQLVQLRIAWHTTALAMNQLKDFYISHVKELPLADALAWKTNEQPSAYKKWGFNFLSMIQVALIGAFTFGWAIWYLGCVFNYWLFIGAPLCGLMYFVFAIVAARERLVLQDKLVAKEKCPVNEAPKIILDRGKGENRKVE